MQLACQSNPQRPGDLAPRLLYELVADLGIQISAGPLDITHEACYSTKQDGSAGSPRMLVENIVDICGEGAVYMHYDYDVPPWEGSSPGQIRILSGGERYLKAMDATGTLAFRQDSILTHLSMLAGFRPHAPYGLRPGELLPAQFTDAAVKGGVYFYGALAACPRSGPGKWVPSGGLPTKDNVEAFLRQGIITVLHVTNVIAGPTGSDQQWAKSGSAPRNARVRGCIVSKACIDAVRMCVGIRDEQELLAFMDEARGVLRVPILYLPKPAREFMKRYVAGGVFLAHSGALLIHTATKDIDPAKKTPIGNASVAMVRQIIPFVRDKSVDDERSSDKSKGNIFHFLFFYTTGTCSLQYYISPKLNVAWLSQTGTWTNQLLLTLCARVVGRFIWWGS